MNAYIVLVSEITLKGIVMSGDGGRSNNEEAKSVVFLVAVVQFGQEKVAKDGGISMPLLGSAGKKSKERKRWLYSIERHKEESGGSCSVSSNVAPEVGAMKK